jgi:hypothetical protein
MRHRCPVALVVATLLAVPALADEAADGGTFPAPAEALVPSVIAPPPLTGAKAAIAALRAGEGLDGTLRCPGASSGSALSLDEAGLPVTLRLDAHEDFVALTESQGVLNDYVARGRSSAPCG